MPDSYLITARRPGWCVITPPHRARAAGGRPRRRAAMALSKLSGDEQGIVFVQLCNVMSSAGGKIGKDPPTTMSHAPPAAPPPPPPAPP